MSWMDSWSRPTKHAATPPPLYLTSNETTPYCHTCGKVIPTRKIQSNSSSSAPVKYCSDRCRHHKPGHLDRRIEEAFVSLLNGLAASSVHHNAEQSKESEPSAILYQVKNTKTKKKKGDPRILASCSDVETAVFGSRHDPEKVFGRKKNRAQRGAADSDDWKSVDMEGANSGEESHGSAEESGNVQNTSDAGHDVKSDYSNFGGGKVRPPQSQAEVNGSVGGEKGRAERNDETAEALKKRKLGERRAEEKEMVRRAARRGCAFGFLVDTNAAATQGKKKKNLADADVTSSSNAQGEERRKKCEAVMNGMAVEASSAKGDWQIRWREDEVGFDSHG